MRQQEYRKNCGKTGDKPGLPTTRTWHKRKGRPKEKEADQKKEVGFTEEIHLMTPSKVKSPLCKALEQRNVRLL